MQTYTHKKKHTFINSSHSQKKKKKKKKKKKNLENKINGTQNKQLEKNKSNKISVKQTAKTMPSKHEINELKFKRNPSGNP